MPGLRNGLVICSAVAMLLGGLGCGEKPSAPEGEESAATPAPPGDSAEGAFLKLQTSVRAGDFGSVYDMLSKATKAAADADVEKKIGSAAAMGPLAMDLLGFDAAELKDLPAREKYARFMKGTHEATVKLESAFHPGQRDKGLAAAEVAGSEPKGDRTTLSLKLPGGGTRAISLVREDGAWKLAERLSARGGEAP